MRHEGYKFNIEHASKFKTFDEFYEAYKGSAYTHTKTGNAISAETQKQLLQDAYSILNPDPEKPKRKQKEEKTEE